MTDQFMKGSVGPKLDQLRFEVINQANELLEQIADLESRVKILESKLSFIIVRGEPEDPELEFTGGS